MVHTGEGVGVSLVVPGTVATPVPSATPGTAASPVPSPHPAALPRTGADLLPLVLLAVLLLLLGAALVAGASTRLKGTAS